ncbi:MAG: AAA family ATPase [Candidatus Natronoplasma sp.]
MITIIVVTRNHTKRLNELSNYTLIYGRRKVGKTFLVKNFIDHDLYFIVKRGGGIIVEDDSIRNIDSFEVFLERLRSELKNGKTVVVDEFQRLPEEFLDHVQSLHPQGRLILTGSSFHVIKDILSPNSPILGLVSEFKLSLISPDNVFTELGTHIDPKKAFELSPYLRDPWTFQYFKEDETDLKDILFFSKRSIPSLTGEIFLEEERTLSEVYEGIIRSLALGRWKLKEIADLLYSRGLIDQPDPSNIRPYFKNMMSMDLVSRIPLHHKKGYRYTIKSPIMELGYLLDERYNFFEEDIPERRLKKVIDDHVPKHVERYCGDLFAELYEGKYEYHYSSDFDIDFIITQDSDVLAVGEVKWTENVSRKDVERFMECTEYLSGDKIFFSKKEFEIEDVISLTPEKLFDLLKDEKMDIKKLR